jgi:hypothetical protein
MLPFEARLPITTEAGVGRQILSSALAAYTPVVKLGTDGAIERMRVADRFIAEEIQRERRSRPDLG